MAKRRKIDFEVKEAPKSEPKPKRKSKEKEQAISLVQSFPNPEIETKDLPKQVTILQEEYDRLINAEIKYKQIERENLVVIEEWSTNGHGVRVPGSKITIFTLDAAMREIGERLKKKTEPNITPDYSYIKDEDIMPYTPDLSRYEVELIHGEGLISKIKSFFNRLF